MKLSVDFDRDFYMNVGYLIRRAHQVADAIFESEMRNLGLTPVQYGILIAVYAHRGIDQFQVGQAIGFDRTTISYVVRKLCAKGLIKALKDPRDRRSNLLQLTAAGEKMLATARPIAARSLDTLLGRLSARDRKKLAAALNVLVHAHEAHGARPRITPRQRAAVARGAIR